MHKINEDEARNLIILGLFPKCEVSRDIFKTVSSERELTNLKNYSNYQSFTLYGWSDKEIKDFTIPKEYCPISLDTAFSQLTSTENPVRAKVLGESKEIVFSSYQEFVSWYKSILVRKDPFLLYA